LLERQHYLSAVEKQSLEIIQANLIAVDHLSAVEFFLHCLHKLTGNSRISEALIFRDEAIHKRGFSALLLPYEGCALSLKRNGNKLELRWMLRRQDYEALQSTYELVRWKPFSAVPEIGNASIDFIGNLPEIGDGLLEAWYRACEEYRGVRPVNGLARINSSSTNLTNAIRGIIVTSESIQEFLEQWDQLSEKQNTNDMGQDIYTETWKQILRAAAKRMKPGEPFHDTQSATAIQTLGSRASDDYRGTFSAFAGKAVNNTNSAPFRDLRNVFKENVDLRNSFPGTFEVRISADGILIIHHSFLRISDLIPKYQTEQMPHHLTDEKFKFQLIQKFQNKWQAYEAGALSFKELMLDYPFNKLIDPARVPSIFMHMLREAPEAWESQIKTLYDETLPLPERIRSYQKHFKDVYFSLPNHGQNPGQDERTIATLLAFRYPDKYALFKDSFYTPLCKAMGIKPKPANEKLLHYYDEIISQTLEAIHTAPDLLHWEDTALDESCYPDPARLLLAQDLLYKTIDNVNSSDEEGTEDNETEYLNTGEDLKPTHPLNTILYGPPGTGKTYSSITHALSIIEERSLESYADEDRTDTKKRFDDLLLEEESSEGQIGFITFHQSLSYEDFIEGIKPTLDNTGLAYQIQPGILKRLAELARYRPDAQTTRFSIPEDIFQKSMFYKMSLGRANTEEDESIYRWCMDNGYIALGWGDAIDFSNKSEAEIRTVTKDEALNDFHADAIKRFVHWIRKGDYVLISEGNRTCRAIGRVVSDYEFRAESPIPYHQFRKVEWLVKDVSIPVEEIYSRTFSMMSIYQLDRNDLKKDFFVKPQSGTTVSESKLKPYVLIIDEINRGNVSQIFGELITLIEDGKREGQPEALSVTLPYSRESFSIPPNLYIIGTMNTADRSVEALDTALRRRFSFIEMPPQESHPDIPIAVKIGESYFNFQIILRALNQRLEKLVGRDHKIGHSYFLFKKGCNWEDCLYAFTDKITPLLQEYFYGDWGKMCLVLGKGFVTVELQESSSDFYAVLPDNNTLSIKDRLNDLQQKETWKLETFSSKEEEKFASALKMLAPKAVVSQPTTP
jgi:hypothetical protein